MGKARLYRIVALAAVTFVFTIVGGSYATFIPGTEATWINVEVTDGEETGNMSWLFPPGLVVAGKTDWQLPAAAIIHGKANPQKKLATIDELIVEYVADPVVTLNFAVTAGNSNTTFTITSANLGFAPIASPQAYATAGVTLTDLDLNGATLTGLQTGGTAFEALYNGSVAWANLIGSMSASAGATSVASGRRPTSPTVWETIPASVSSIQSEYKFTLTANDTASGTSTFEVVPEPATVLLVALGGLVVRRRLK